MEVLLKGAAFCIILLAFLWQHFKSLIVPDFSIPDHMKHHPVIFEENYLSSNQIEALQQMVKDIGNFTTQIASHQRLYETKYEDIGEGFPIPENGKCPHSYMVPSPDRTRCVFAARIDEGRATIIEGGINAHRETIAKRLSRVLSFVAFANDLEKDPIIGDIFNNEKLENAVEKICPENTVLEPFWFVLLVQLPGQEITTHIDSVSYWGATRYNFPQWLLVIMKFSGLFEDHFVPNVQGVAYFHSWSDNRESDFNVWVDDDEYVSIPPTSGSSSFIDGTRSIHGATTYRPDAYLPTFDKDAVTELIRVGEDDWHLQSDGKTLNTYVFDDLRLSLVFRGRCVPEGVSFIEDEKQNVMDLDQILEVFSADLKKKGVWTESMKNSRIKFGEALVDTYVRYPQVAKPWFPWNYCLITEILPFLKPYCGEY